MIKEHLEEYLFNLLAQGYNLTQLSEKVRKEVFLNPIMITSDSFRVLYLGADTEIEDKIWEQAKVYNGFTDDVMQTFKNSLDSSYVLKDKKAILYDTDFGEKIPRILCPIYSDSDFLGIITIIGYYHPIKYQELHYSTIFAKALAILLHKSHHMIDSQLGVTDYYLKSILDSNNNIGQLPDAQTRLKKHFRILVTPLPNDQVGKQFLSYLKNSIISITKGVNCFPYEGHMFISINYDDSKIMEDCMRRLEKIFIDFHLSAGTGYPFDNILELSTQYSLAMDTLNVASKLSDELSIKYLDQYLEYIEIAKFSETDLHSLLSPEYKLIDNYDTLHDGNILKTVLAYFKNNLNINQTADEIYVHRNTVAYRLQVAEEILNVDTLDTRVLEKIQHSYHIRLWGKCN